MADDSLDRVEGGEARSVVLSRLVYWLATIFLIGLAAIQAAYDLGLDSLGFANFRPVMYAFLFWSVALGVRQVVEYGEAGQQRLFLLPALLFTASMVIFPTIFGLYIAFTNWNLNAEGGHHLNGLDNLRTLIGDTYFWNALANMVYYLLTVFAQYAIAFGLAMLLNADIRARRLFRVAFLMPFMLSPVAVSWMIGKSIMEVRFGPLANFLRFLGWENPAFFSSPWIARLSVISMDAWVWIPFMIILLLAGLQALPHDVKEAARVDGANSWQMFWEITFPLMLPVTITTIVLRMIFELKLADIVINVTAGGPGGATDTISSFVYREYRDRSNVGYGTMIAEVYLILIIVFITLLLKVVRPYMRKMT